MSGSVRELVWSGRNGSLAVNGSESSTPESATATAAQSVSASSRTARGNEAEATPNPVLEALDGQISTAKIATHPIDPNRATCRQRLIGRNSSGAVAVTKICPP